MAVIYQILSVIALALLTVPLVSLGGSAARLSARRRDDRLATLRLLGATPGMVARLTVLESTALAAVGAITGVLGYFVLVPLVGLIPFRGEPLGAGQLILPWWGIVAMVAVVAAVSAVSALVGLRQVIVSPLGVRTRQNAPKLHWLRVLIGVAVVALGYGLTQILGVAGDITIIAAILGLAFGGTMAVLNLVGPFILRLLASRQARRAQSAPRLLAARAILDSPRAAWRQVSGVAMTSFMSVAAGSGVAIVDSASANGSTVREEMLLVTDMGTGLILILAISFVMVACSVGINQSADVFDRGEHYANLGYLGMPRRMLDAARERAVMWPLLVVCLGSAAIAAIIVFPLVGLSLMIAPLSLLTIAASLAMGIGIVWLGMRLTRPVLTARLALAA
jgi:hypothetical protein